ncbi:unnamed protein product [Cylindrotheca closterium]|uniref:Bulb-type lectin domain-containing protein n=1 Tax=Cylindrotheca closterium TaxID=2856 RepID=A0AAD2CVS0_9STRA|nr:unnamed protein product [Cylindrotheca closterium]
MRLSSNTVLLSLLTFICCHNDDGSNFAEASKLRRGSAKRNEEIEDISSSPIPEDSSATETTRSLLSYYSTLTDAEILALKKTPPSLQSSKCGNSMFRKQHPGCKTIEEALTKAPSEPLFSSPTASPTQPLTTTNGPTDVPSQSPPPKPTREPSTQPSTRPSTRPSTQPSISPSTMAPSTSFPTESPTRVQDRPLNCIQTVKGNELTIRSGINFRKGDVHCLISDNGDDGDSEAETYFGYTWTNQFGLFSNNTSVWTVPSAIVSSFDRWTFQDDGNLVLRDGSGKSIWTARTHGNRGAKLKVSVEQVWIESNDNVGSTVWSQPPYIATLAPFTGEYPDPSTGLQYYAYYYPWYLRDNWSRHGYQDEPLLGKYGTDEVAVAEQHIEWALQTGISSWIISYWGPDHLTMKHFKAGMMNAPSLNKINFCMLYESVILDDRGNWRDGSKEEALYRDLKVIVDEFFDHPSYLKINGRPVIIFYITRSRMAYDEGFDGPSVIANMRRRLGHDIYFIADEPFFDWDNKSPEDNGNAFKDGKQVFDAYTTYNMFRNSVVRQGETATDYQMREAMPIWKRWAEQLPLFPNVMPQYYDFRGHKPLLGNSADFMKQLREVACLPQTNFDGAPHIMMITSFNEWWEGTQIEPEDGSPDNWNNYGFQFMETLATFKKEMDSLGAYWCPEDTIVEEADNGKRG